MTKRHLIRQPAKKSPNKSLSLTVGTFLVPPKGSVTYWFLGFLALFRLCFIHFRKYINFEKKLSKDIEISFRQLLAISIAIKIVFHAFAHLKILPILLSVGRRGGGEKFSFLNCPRMTCIYLKEGKKILSFFLILLVSLFLIYIFFIRKFLRKKICEKLKMSCESRIANWNSDWFFFLSKKTNRI